MKFKIFLNLSLNAHETQNANLGIFDELQAVELVSDGSRIPVIN
jgi:hypothetical protein